MRLNTRGGYSIPVPEIPAPEPEPDPSELIVRAARQLRRRWMASLEPWNITPHEYRALHASTQDEPPRLSEIAERLRIAPRSATEVIDSLEAKGLVRRLPSPTDRRAILVEPTAAGHTLAAEVAHQRSELGEAMLAPLTSEEVTQLRALLAKVVEEPVESALMPSRSTR